MERFSALRGYVSKDLVHVLISIVNDIEKSALDWINAQLSSNWNVVTERISLDISDLREELRTKLLEDPRFRELSERLDEIYSSTRNADYFYGDEIQAIEAEMNEIEKRSPSDLQDRINWLEHEWDFYYDIFHRYKDELKKRLLPRVIEVMREEGKLDANDLSEHAMTKVLPDIFIEEVDKILE